MIDHEDGHDATLTERDVLILDHMPLLHHIVGRLAVDMPARIDREDLAGYGMLGLIAAADSFEVSRGLKFSTYAYPKIRGAILDELRKLDFLPRNRREKLRDLGRCVARMEQEKGSPPSPEEIASELELGLDEVGEILFSATLSSTTSLDDGTGMELGALISDPTSRDPVGSAEWEEARDVLALAVSELPEQECSVITLYYAEDLLLKEIVEILGVTESRVSQIHTRALYRLNVGLQSSIGSP